MFSNASVPLVGIVDTAVMGRMDSPTYISATAIATVIFSSLYWMFGFLQMGTGGLVAQAFGANNRRTILETTQRAALIAIVIGAILTSLAKPIFGIAMLAMEGTEQLHSLTADYFFIRILAAPATLLLYVMQGSLIGQQRMRAVFCIQLFLNLGNVILNLLLFNMTDWNIQGVAIATVVSEILAMILGLYLLRNELFLVRLPLSAIFAKDKLLSLFQLSRDLFIRTACLTFAFYWLTVMASRLGDLTLAANAILLQLMHFMSYALDGFSTSAEALAGQAIGRKDPKALIGAVRACMEWAVGFAFLFTLIYATWGGSFVDSMTTQPETRVAAKYWLPWVVWAPLVGVWSFLLDGIFIGTTHTREMRNGMIIAVVCFLGSTIYFLPTYANNGLWFSYYVLMVVRTITLGTWFPRILRAAIR